MTKTTNISIAVASFENEKDLRKTCETIKIIHNLSLDVDNIVSIWRDIKRAPINYAVAPWAAVWNER